MWEVKNMGLYPIESPITKIRFIPNKSFRFDMDSLPKDVKKLVDKGMLSAIRISTNLSTQLEVEKELHKIADEIFLDWYL